ncbi:MAG: hypothetical protein F9K22_12710 [Bacteroidetes bacterium]|nr:MAG: hypothetical protein F9K22_12710 [Bacteroidota bacterium]
MPPPTTYGPDHNDEIRRYVLRRDRQTCQWPGCGATQHADVLFMIETDNGGRNESPFYKNGLLLCPKHMEMVNLHDKAFGPLIYDLIQLIEFEQDLQTTEKVYKDLLK